jgi:chorismate mutase
MGKHKFLVVSTEALPEVYLKVIEAKALLKKREVRGVTEAAKKVDISRSTFYKYCDSIFTLEEKMSNKTVTLHFVLSHKSGVLSSLLQHIATHNGNVLTLTQDPPSGGVADVKISFDASGLIIELDELIDFFKTLEGVVQVDLTAIE